MVFFHAPLFLSSSTPPPPSRLSFSRLPLSGFFSASPPPLLLHLLLSLSLLSSPLGLPFPSPRPCCASWVLLPRRLLRVGCCLSMALLCYCVCVEACLCSLNTVLCSLEVERFFPRIVPRPFSPLAPCLSPSPVCRLLYLLRSLVSAPGVVGSVRMHPLYACSKMHPSESSCSAPLPPAFTRRGAPLTHPHVPSHVTRAHCTLHTAQPPRAPEPSSTCNVAAFSLKFLIQHGRLIPFVLYYPSVNIGKILLNNGAPPLLLWLKYTQY